MDKRSFLKNALFLGAGMPVFLKNLDGWVNELEHLSPWILPRPRRRIRKNVSAQLKLLASLMAFGKK